MPQMNIGLTLILEETEMNTYDRISGKSGGCTT